VREFSNRFQLRTAVVGALGLVEPFRETIQLAFEFGAIALPQPIQFPVDFAIRHVTPPPESAGSHPAAP